MRSIKPGRGPSMMGGFGAIIASIFGIFWTILAASAGAPFPFPLFGVLFVLVGVGQAVFHFKNATGKNRYSSFDIVGGSEEPDPLNQRFGEERPVQEDRNDGTELNFCPYCGAGLGADFEFCGKCGRKLPEIQ